LWSCDIYSEYILKLGGDSARLGVIVPEVGMCFDSEKSAYEMYNSYAGKVGFSIRKSDTKRRAEKTVYSKQIVYSKV
jgi:zinc finger SWIM domain-containing protein 3